MAKGKGKGKNKNKNKSKKHNSNNRASTSSSAASSSSSARQAQRNDCDNTCSCCNHSNMYDILKWSYAEGYHYSLTDNEELEVFLSGKSLAEKKAKISGLSHKDPKSIYESNHLLYVIMLIIKAKETDTLTYNNKLSLLSEFVTLAREAVPAALKNHKVNALYFSILSHVISWVSSNLNRIKADEASMGMLNNLMDNIIQFFEPMAVFKGTIGTVMGIYHESLEEIIRFSNKLWAFIDRCIELNVSFVLELFNRIEALSAFIKEINSYVSMLKLMEPDKITAHVFGSFKELKSHEPWLSLLQEKCGNWSAQDLDTALGQFKNVLESESLTFREMMIIATILGKLLYLVERMIPMVVQEGTAELAKTMNDILQKLENYIYTCHEMNQTKEPDGYFYDVQRDEMLNDAVTQLLTGYFELDKRARPTLDKVLSTKRSEENDKASKGNKSKKAAKRRKAEEKKAERAKAEVEERAKAEAERAKAEVEERAKAEAEARAIESGLPKGKELTHQIAEGQGKKRNKGKTHKQRKAEEKRAERAKAEAREREEAEALAKVEVDEQEKADAEVRAKAEVEAGAKALELMKELEAMRAEIERMKTDARVKEEAARVKEEAARVKEEAARVKEEAARVKEEAARVKEEAAREREEARAKEEVPKEVLFLYFDKPYEEIYKLVQEKYNIEKRKEEKEDSYDQELLCYLRGYANAQSELDFMQLQLYLMGLYNKSIGKIKEYYPEPSKEIKAYFLGRYSTIFATINSLLGIEEPKDRPDEAEIEDYSKQLTRLQVQSQASSSQQAVPHIPSMMMGYPNQMVQPYPNQMMLYPAQMMAFYQSPMGVYPVPGALGYSAPRPPENSEADPGGILRFFNPTRLPSGEAQGTNVAQGTRVVPGQSGAS